MKIGITPLIAENIAPTNATKLVVFDGENKICSIDITKLKPSNLGNKLYSFGLVSDIHILATEIPPNYVHNTKFDNALLHFENKGCSFCVICGDLTQTGLYRSPDDTTANAYLDEILFKNYKAICDKHTLPIYELMGNHESYYGKPIINHLDKMETYTGNSSLSYTVSRGNDLFILIGQPKDLAVMTDEDFTWLRETLETNKDKRCFVFVHSYIEEDSGDSCDVRENSIFYYWGATKTNAFINLIKQYDNVILFHGHSHMKLECQSLDKTANYTTKNGFKSVHVPSSAAPRDVDTVNNKSVDDFSASQSYIVDVYDDCIVLNGMDLITNNLIPIGLYKIDTVKEV